MKRIFAVWSILLFCVLTGSAQDSALEQRLNELNGRIETLLESQEGMRKQIAALAQEISTVREQQNKPLPASASQEDLKRLADAVREVDRKRLDDYDKIRAELLKLGKTLTASAPMAPKASTRETHKESAKDSGKEATPETVFEYEVQKGDTLSLILQAYREKNVKVTMDQVLKANPGLKPERLRPGQKISIPVPKS